jgi:hypothetical protein
MVRFKPIGLLIACPMLTSLVLGGLPSRVHEFAHVADGVVANLKMKTTIYVRNQGMTEANITVKFYNDSGEPWAVRIGTTEASTHTAKIAADGMAKLTTAGTGELGAGWATLTADREVGAQLFFEISENGKLATQAAVEPVGSMHAVELFVDFDMSAGQRTALAIANLSDIGPVEVSVRLSDETGGDNRSGGLNVPSLGHTAKYIDEIFAMEQIEKYRGTVQLLADGPITVLALQQTGLVIGTLAPMQRTLIGRFGGEE